MGIFYVLTVIAMLVTFILFRKSEKKQNLVRKISSVLEDDRCFGKVATD